MKRNIRQLKTTSPTYLSIFIPPMRHLSWAQNFTKRCIDHLTISVNDLAQVRRGVKALGFTNKPG
jgi:hypothetical protein